MATQEEIAKLLISLEGEVRDLQAKFTQGEKAAKGLGKTVNKVGASVKRNWLAMTAVIGGTVYAIKKVHDQYANFEHKMLEVNTLIGKSSKEMNAYKKELLSLTRQVPQTATELANALYDVVSAGVSVGEAMQVVGQSAKAAVAGVTDTKTAARAGLAVMNAYGKTTEELGEIYDQLFKTVKVGVTTFPQISAAIGTVLPVASAAGVEFKEIAASLATATKSGIDTARATTFMRSGIMALAAPTKEAQEAMDAMGITWEGSWVPTLRKLAPILNRFKTDQDKLKALRQIIPDVRSAQVIVALTNNIDDLNASMQEMDDSKGAMEEAFRIMEESPVNKMKMLGNALTQLALVIGTKLNPAIMKFAEGLTVMLGANDDVRFVDLMNEEAELQKKINKLRERATKLEEDKGKWYKSQHHTMKQLGKTYLEIGQSQKRLKEIEEERASIVPSVASYRAKMNAPSVKKAPKAPGGLDASDAGGGGGGTGTSLASALLSEMRSVAGMVQLAMAELDKAYADGIVSVQTYYATKRETIREYSRIEIQYLEDVLALTDDENKQRQIKAQILTLTQRAQAKVVKLEQEEAEAIKKTTAEMKEQAEERKKLLSGIQSRGVNTGEGFAAIKERQAAERKALEEQHVYELQKLEELEATKDEIIAAHTAHRNEMQMLSLQQFEESASNLLSSMGAIVGSIADIYTELYNKEMQQERNRIDTVISNMRKEGASEKQIAAKKEELQRTGYVKAKELYEKQKKAQIAMAIINGAQAILKGYADYGPIVGSILAVLTGVITGIQIAKISQQTFPGYAEGGPVRQGTGPKSDDVHARLSRGEFVAPADSVAHYGENVYEAMRRKAVPKSMFSMIPSLSAYRPTTGRFAEGGMVTQQGAGGSLNASQSLTIVNVLDQSTFDQYMETPEGEKAVVNVIGRRDFEVRQIILEGEAEEGEV